MQGKRIKQINNLVITFDEKAQLFRAYNLAGIEVFRDSMKVVIEQKCRNCFDYVEKKDLKSQIVLFKLGVQDEEDEIVTYTAIIEVMTNKNIKGIGKQIQECADYYSSKPKLVDFNWLVHTVCEQIFNQQGIKYRVINPDVTIDVAY